MPPETVQEEGATRYNTAIDIFSFGVVSLFMLTQTFPKDLKPATFRYSKTRRLVTSSEIERHEHIQPMQAALGETHPLVKLTLDCLEYDPEDRPSAMDVLRRLEEVGRTVPQNCTETKLELIKQKVEYQRLLSVKDLEHRAILRESNSQIGHLQATVNRLQAEKQEQVHRHKELTSLHQQLDDQRREIERLSSQLRPQFQPCLTGQERITQPFTPKVCCKCNSNLHTHC